MLVALINVVVTARTKSGGISLCDIEGRRTEVLAGELIGGLLGVSYESW